VRAVQGRAARDAALDAAEKWVSEPGEPQRLAALEVGGAASKRAATTWLALAAGWSGGNIAGHGVARAKPHLTAKAVRAAIILALAEAAVRDPTPWITAFVEAAIRFVRGGDATPAPLTDPAGASHGDKRRRRSASALAAPRDEKTAPARPPSLPPVNLFCLTGLRKVSAKLAAESESRREREPPMPLKRHGRYDYSALPKRPVYEWPQGRRLAVYLALNLETLRFRRRGWGRRSRPKRKNLMMLNYAWRDWGNRVGAWRLSRALRGRRLAGVRAGQLRALRRGARSRRGIFRRGDEIVAHGRTKRRNARALSAKTTSAR